MNQRINTNFSFLYTIYSFSALGHITLGKLFTDEVARKFAEMEIQGAPQTFAIWKPEWLGPRYLDATEFTEYWKIAGIRAVYVPPEEFQASITEQRQKSEHTALSSAPALSLYTHAAIIINQREVDVIPATSEEAALEYLRNRAENWEDSQAVAGIDRKTATLSQLNLLFADGDPSPECMITIGVLEQPSITLAPDLLAIGESILMEWEQSQTGNGDADRLALLMRQLCTAILKAHRKAPPQA